MLLSIHSTPWRKVKPPTFSPYTNQTQTAKDNFWLHNVIVSLLYMWSSSPIWQGRERREKLLLFLSLLGISLCICAVSSAELIANLKKYCYSFGGFILYLNLLEEKKCRGGGSVIAHAMMTVWMRIFLWEKSLFLFLHPFHSGHKVCSWQYFVKRLNFYFSEFNS